MVTSSNKVARRALHTRLVVGASGGWTSGGEQARGATWGPACVPFPLTMTASAVPT